MVERVVFEVVYFLLLQLSSDSSDSEENGMENVQKKDEHAKVLCESQARDADVSVVNESENVRTLKAKIAELEHINKQLYSYAASLILDEE
ncbi:unnamed protein product [Toxocara canis]|uniref:HOOK domain-containing protein n=1 Tax=Toxocara canis TaxID=6265 RepID=A0A183VF83_TOXCA|nr:unnamed protein product [Toxocara canis]